jgi:hypothetical protein
MIIKITEKISINIINTYTKRNTQKKSLCDLCPYAQTIYYKNNLDRLSHNSAITIRYWTLANYRL